MDAEFCLSFEKPRVRLVFMVKVSLANLDIILSLPYCIHFFMRKCCLELARGLLHVPLLFNAAVIGTHQCHHTVVTVRRDVTGIASSGIGMAFSSGVSVFLLQCSKMV